MLGDWPPSCLDISLAISDVMNSYDQSRHVLTNTLRDLKDDAVQLDSRGRPHIHVPNLPDAALALTQESLYAVDDANQLKFLAGMYSAYGCWSFDWDGVDDVFAGGGAGAGTSGGGEMNYSCDWYQMYVSEDGGQTWQPLGEPYQQCIYEAT